MSVSREVGPDAPEVVRLCLAVRQLNEWTQADLAQQLGVSVSTIAAWENERAQPHWVWTRALREILEDGA